MHKTFVLISILIPLALYGCAKPQPPTQSVEEADQKMSQLLKDEYELENILVAKAGTTRIIHVPFDEPIFTVKSTKPMFGSGDAKEAFHIAYLDSMFQEGKFTVKYDIVPVKKYDADSQGYASAYNPKFQKIQRNILSSVHRAYADLDPTLTDLKPPEFIHLQITDVKTGLRSSTVSYYPDLSGAMSMPPTVSQEEYVKRTVTELTGNQKYIDDVEGVHIDQQPVTWPDFLAKQIKNRINFKFQYSDFTPEGDLSAAIVQMIADTLKNYDFDGYSEVILKNLNEDTTQAISKDKLPDANKENIKVHHLKFF